MKRHANALLRRGASVAGYGEVASASVSIKTHTRHGYLAGLDFVVVYEFRGPEASEIAWGADHTDALTAAFNAHFNKSREGVASNDAKDCGHTRLAQPLAHTWWPRQPHLGVMLSSVYTVAGLDFFSGIDDLNTARAVVPGSAWHVADDLYQHIRNQVGLRHMADSTWAHVGNPVGDWGALPMLVLARAWPIADSYAGEHWCNDNPNYRSRLPRSPWLASRYRPWTTGGLPDLNDPEAIGAFHALASHRDAALKSAIIRGFHPYSYDGMRIMFRKLRRVEQYASSEDAAVISGLKVMRRQLYTSPYRM